MSVKNKVQEYYQKHELPLPNYKGVRCGGPDHMPLWKSVVTVSTGQQFEGGVYNSKAKADEDAAQNVSNWLESQKHPSTTYMSPHTQREVSYQSVPSSSSSYSSSYSSHTQSQPQFQFQSASLSQVQIGPQPSSLPPVQVLSGVQTSKVNISNLIQDVSTTSLGGKKTTTRVIIVPHMVRTYNRRMVLLVDVENMPNFIDEVLKEIQGLSIYAFVGYHHALCDKQFPSSVTKILSPSTRTDGTDTCMQVYVGYFLANDMFDIYLIATRDHFGSSLVDMITAESLLWTPKNGKVVTKVRHLDKL